MKRTAYAAIAALVFGGASIVYAGIAATTQQGNADDPQTIRQLLIKFEEAQATAPLRYPTACVAGTAETYTRMAIGAELQNAGDVQLNLWTVPEPFGRVDHPESDRASGRCDYRVSIEGESHDAHFIADFFSRKRPRAGEIAYAKVWQQGSDKAVLVAFPNGPRGINPDITFKVVPVGTQPFAKP